MTDAAVNVEEALRTLREALRTLREALGADGFGPDEEAVAVLDALWRRAKTLTQYVTEAVAMLRAAEQRAERAKARVAELEAAIEDYLLWQPGRRGHAAAHERLSAALAGGGDQEDRGE